MNKANTKPLVSIIVPVYNIENKLDRCIGSLLNQTYQNLQIILVDDGSKDKSGAICDHWASQDQRITVLHQRNAGVSAARNTGLDAARGKYVAFVDSDDHVDVRMYETMIRAATEHHADQVCCCLFNDFKTGRQQEMHAFGDRVICGDDVYSELIRAMVDPEQAARKARLLQSPCNKLYRRKLIDKNNIRFDTELPYAEDWLFNLNFYRFARCVSFIPDCLYYYDRTTEGSLSKKVRQDGFTHSYRLRSKEKEWVPELHTEESFRNLVLRIQSHYLNQYARLCGYVGFGKYAGRLYRTDALRETYVAAQIVPIKYRLPHFCFKNGSGKFHEWLYCVWATIHVSFTALKYYIKKMIGK